MLVSRRSIASAVLIPAKDTTVVTVYKAECSTFDLEAVRTGANLPVPGTKQIFWGYTFGLEKPEPLLPKLSRICHLHYVT
jgi:hypothetical protein